MTMTSVLVVEDDDIVTYTLKQMLKSAGYEVTSAHNGRQAVEAYAVEPADLVITDILMPEKDGVETILELRRLDPEVRIIAMSGGGRTRNLEFLKLARRLGARAVLAKPFTREELLMAVVTALE